MHQSFGRWTAVLLAVVAGLSACQRQGSDAESIIASPGATSAPPPSETWPTAQTASQGACLDGVWHERRLRQWHCRGDSGAWDEWRPDGDWYSTGLLCETVDATLSKRGEAAATFIGGESPDGRQVFDLWLFEGQTQAWMLDGNEPVAIAPDRAPVQEPQPERVDGGGHRFPVYGLEARCIEGSLHVRRLRLVRGASAAGAGGWTAVAPWHDTGQSCAGLALREPSARRAAELLSSGPEPLAIREYVFPREVWRAATEASSWAFTGE
jgi:hypothetical protein